MGDFNCISVDEVPCGLCGGDKFDFTLKARDFRFGHPQEYMVVRCKQCGLLCTNPRPTLAGMAELYEHYYTPQEPKVSSYRPVSTGLKRLARRLWHQWIGECRERIPATGRFLDVGCGYGHALSFFAAQGLEVYGVELNSLAVDACRQRGFSVFCGSLEEANLPTASFDTISLRHVIEHLPAPLQTLGEIYRLLAPGGTVHIFCPNADSYLIRLFGQYWHGWHLPFHFYHFTTATLRSLAETGRFTISALRTVTPVNCLTVSLKAYLYSRESEYASTINRGQVYDSIPARAALSLPLRILDQVLPSQGDCLWAILRKD
jgi:SAM-dependent methyltransferase